MSLTTFSSFYYGIEITPANNMIYFDEGNGIIHAEIPVGLYTHTQAASVFENALRSSGTLDYNVTVSRETRKITVSASAPFAIEGTSLPISAWPEMGFVSDDTGLESYEGQATGFAYEPQFILQDYVASTDRVGASQATVNKTASGRVEVIKFGTEQFMECSIKYVTDIQQDGSVIKTNPNGVSALRNFMHWLIEKAPVEFIPNIKEPQIFETMILESTPDSRDGVSFKLRELYGVGLAGYFETGVLTFRKIGA